MLDRRYSGSLVVACAGPDEPTIKQTAFGEMRCRTGASLKHAAADAYLVFGQWSTDENVSSEAHILLIDPSFTEFASAIERISTELGSFPQGETGIDLYFAGHGRQHSGALVLKDRDVSATQFIELIKDNMSEDQGIRGISMMLDSCYSAAFLFSALVKLQDDSGVVRLYDALCSSMHDEKSWELSFLGHGAFTFTQFHKGNSYVDSAQLSRAIDEQDQTTIAKCIQGLVASMADPTTFLTQGKQHTVDCRKGGRITTRTRGSADVFELDQPFDFQMITEAFRTSVE